MRFISSEMPTDLKLFFRNTTAAPPSTLGGFWQRVRKNVKRKGIGDSWRNRWNACGCGSPSVGEANATPGEISDVWQIRDLERWVFGSVAMAGLTGEFSDVWQIRELGDRE